MFLEVLVARAKNASPAATNVARVDIVLEQLRRDRPMTAYDEALGQAALTHAATLDHLKRAMHGGHEGAGTVSAMASASASVSRELRATLAELTKDSDGGDDDDWTAGLSAQVRDPKEP